jgi:hypothetical protein
MSTGETPKRPPVIAPAAKPTDERMPLPSGVIGKVSRDSISGSRLTAMEQEAIAAAGGKEGGTLPDFTDTALAAKMTAQVSAARHVAEHGADDMLPVSPDTPPLVVPEARDISDLPPADRAELSAAVQQAEMQDKVAAAAATPDPLGDVPGLSAAHEMATAAPTIELVDDVTPPATPAPEEFDPTVAAATTKSTAPPVLAEPLDETPAFAPVVEDAPETAELQQAEEEQKMLAGTDLKPVDCPKCGHLLEHDVVPVTDPDKHRFIMSIEGSQRFRKEYTIYDGRIQFTLRSLTPSDADLAVDQLDELVRTEKIQSRAQWMKLLMDYRLAMAISRFERVGGGAVNLQLPEDVKFDPEKDHTCLPALHKYVQNRLFGSEHVSRAVGQEFMRFQRLQEILEARAPDPDFYTGTGQPT